jgi:DNA-binding response OmpR family regulator
LASNGYFVRINDAAPRRQPKRTPPIVMVVEDDEVTAILLERILVANGFQVTKAANRAAILVGLKNFPDLIILDVLMPDANGFDILNRIRQHQVLKDLPVMMLTSLGSLDDILKGLKLGANGYLTKPAKSKSLLDAIRKVLGD